VFQSLCLIAVGVALLALGGELLLRGAVGLATRFHLTPAVIGLTVVAAGTSVPELAVSGMAAFNGKPDLAFANIVGSNIFNITFMIGLCALVRPFAIPKQALHLEFPAAVAATLLFWWIVNDGVVSRFEAALCLTAYVAFVAYLLRLVHRQELKVTYLGLDEKAAESHPGVARTSVNVVLVAFGVLLLAVGAHATVAGAVAMARRFGWSERLIGLTIVAAGTDLPEVFASVMSARRGRSDVALGNAIGSNLFNMLVILGVTGLASPLHFDPAAVASDCRWLLGLTLLLFPLMLRGRSIGRGAGAFLVAAYATYVAFLIFGTLGNSDG